MDVPALPKARIKVVGTSHIARASAQRIRHSFAEFHPDIVCVELDRGRLDALKEQATGAKEERLPFSMVKQIGITGYLFAIIAKTVQRKLGNIVDVNPGIDMLTAVRLGQSQNLPVELIDQDILVTLRHLSKRFTLREKGRVLWDIITAPFSKRLKGFPLDQVPNDEVLGELLSFMRTRYPSLYHVLIVERNIVMAARLDAIVRHNPGKRVMVVVGAGHQEDLRMRLRLLERLAEIE